MRVRWSVALIVVAALLVVGCSSSDGEGSATASTEAGGTAGAEPNGGGTEPDGTEPATDRLDISGADPCALLDAAALAALVGPVELTSRADTDSCFWGATTPGEPGYVELTVRSQDQLSTLPNGCAAEAISGLGEAAEGSTCSISDQTKVIAHVLDRGVFVGIMVNEPSSPIEPADVGRAIEGVFAQLDGAP